MEDAVSINIPTVREKELCVNTFGHSVTAPDHCYGPAVRPYYLIHYILTGKGEYLAGNTTYHLAAGQGFFIEPNCQTVYKSDDTDPWSYIWVGFSGTLAPRISASLGLSSAQPVFRSSESRQLSEYVMRMMRHNHGSTEDTYYNLGMLFLFLSAVAASNRDTLPATDGNFYATQAINYIQNHIDEPIQTEDIARYVGLNRTYFSRIFKEHTGLSPLKYIQALRLTRAKHLLESTDLSISAIALSCGYERPESLAKIFSQHYGMSPVAYRLADSHTNAALLK